MSDDAKQELDKRLEREERQHKVSVIAADMATKLREWNSSLINNDPNEEDTALASGIMVILMTWAQRKAKKE